MSIQFDIAKQIIAKTCPNRKLKLENIRLFADIIQLPYGQDERGAASSLHGFDSWPGHKARIDGAPLSFRAWLPLSS